MSERECTFAAVKSSCAFMLAVSPLLVLIVSIAVALRQSSGMQFGGPSESCDAACAGRAKDGTALKCDTASLAFVNR